MSELIGPGPSCPECGEGYGQHEAWCSQYVKPTTPTTPEPATDEQIAILDAKSVRWKNRHAGHGCGSEVHADDIATLIARIRSDAAKLADKDRQIAELRNELKGAKVLFGEYADCLQSLCMDRLYNVCAPVSYSWPGKRHVETIVEAADFMEAKLACVQKQLDVAEEALKTIAIEDYEPIGESYTEATKQIAAAALAAIAAGKEPPHA